MVLIHDDSLRKLVCLVMEQLGLDVFATGNVDSACASIQNARPSLMICKQRRGLVDSLNVLERLKGDPATSSIPVVLLTADTRVAPQRRFLSAGGKAVIQLPFTPEELQDAVLRILGDSA